MRTYLALGGALLLLLAAFWVKGALLTLPDVRSAPAAGEFDTARALARLGRILPDQRPHPVDSTAGDAVRERILAEMRAVGLDPQVTDDFACNSMRRGRGVSCARVRNIVATIGPGGGRHLLAVAHYDSSTAGPGAVDDGIGVATLLEVAAQLRGRPLARPLTFLINEGEEAGLIGARAFNDRHPVARNTDALVNFEARGVTGPAIMFETSRPNGSAIAAFAADRPVANSLTTDFYRLIPNSTDVAVFEERNWTILNFAVIGNETRYHSAGDTLAALDPRSVQHMGDQALATIRRLAEEPPEAGAGEVHYTDVAGRMLIVLPAMLSFALLAILLLFWAWTGWRRRSGLGLAIAMVVAGLVDAAVIGWVAQFAISLFRDGAWWRGHPEITGFAVAVSALAACAGPMLLLRQRRIETVRAAFWLVLMVLAIILTLVAPGGAILFLLPPLVAALGIRTRWEQAAALLAAALLLLLFAPLLELLETLLGHGSAWMFAPLAAAILWPWLIELKPLIAKAGPKPVLGGIGGALAAAWLWAALAPAYSEDRRQRFSIEYAVDADSGQARWAVANDGASLPDAFPGAWTRGEVPWSSVPRWTAPAPSLPVGAPSLELSSQREAPGGRLLTVRMRGAGFDSVALRAPPQAVMHRVRAGAFTRSFGEGGDEDPWYLRCVGRSCDGATFEILVGGRTPIELTLIASTTALPEAARPLLAARPRLSRPQYSPDSTIVTRRFRL
jgi:hypothetical protein